MGTSSNALKLRGPIRLYHCYSLKGFLALKSKKIFNFFSREKRVRVRVKIWELLQTRSNSEDQFVCIIAIVWRAFWLWNPKFFFFFSREKRVLGFMGTSSREKRVRVRVRVKIWELLQTRSNSEDQFVCIIAIVWRAFWLWNPKLFFFFLGKNELGLGLKYGNFFKRAQTPRTNSSVSLL